MRTKRGACTWLEQETDIGGACFDRPSTRHVGVATSGHYVFGVTGRSVTSIEFVGDAGTVAVATRRAASLPGLRFFILAAPGEARGVVKAKDDDATTLSEETLTP